MTHGEMGPEFAIGPRHIFNIAALSDALIFAYSRALYHATEPAMHSPEDLSVDDMHDAFVLDIHDALANDVRDYAKSDPERVIGLVREAALGEHAADLFLAAQVSPGLLDPDYEFARDTFVGIYAAASRDETLERVRVECVGELENLMTEVLSPMQAADFNAHLSPHGLDFRAE